MIKGSVQKAKSGGTPTLAPIGYLNVKKIVDGQIIRSVEVDTERAPLVQWAFETYATGKYGLNQLHTEVTRKGLLQRPTKTRPARPMHISRLAAMLHNRYYIGVVTYRKVEYEGKHEPLVSRETFEKVQQVAQVHDRAGERHRVHHHYLKGSLFCARCGSRMTVARAKGHGGTYLYLFCYFFCLGRQFRYGGCDSRYVAVERVEDWIGNYYSITQLEEERVDDVRAQLLKELEQQRSRTARGVKRRTARLTRLTHERGKLLDAYYANKMPLDLFGSEQERITRAISEANEVMMLKDFEFRQVARTVTEAIELAADWGGAYREASDQIRRRMNQAFFKRFLVDFGGVTRAEVTDDFAAMLMHDLVARFEQQAPEPTRRYDAEASDLVLLG